MARRRFAVALLIGSPLGDEIDGLRRACGDSALGRVPPHITIVPPVNVRDSDVDAAFEVLRSAVTGGAVNGAITCTVGAAATFHPVNPVAYLRVAGDVGELDALRSAVLVTPLQRR